MRKRRGGPKSWPMLWCLLFICLGPLLRAQTTQGIITGRLIDSRTGDPLQGASVRYAAYHTGETGVALTDSRGLYSLPSLARGLYSLRAEKRDYQAREMQILELNVAARLEIDFKLRPLSEVLEPGDYNSALLPGEQAILPVIGPDLEAGRSAPLEVTAVRSAIRQPSLSYVIDPKEISEAPLSARNVYALMTTLPGVTAAQVIGRGLQISANGQRASASNFLLDGVQNNDFLNTGPFSATAPEAVQEYRVSTNNYSAEYGQTGGFVANAVTRGGGASYHGIVYSYLGNQSFDANTFQNNANRLPKNPLKQLYAGYSAGGPIVRERLSFSSSFEQLRSRSRQNERTVGIFLADRLRQCLGASSSPILELYDKFPLLNPLNVTDYSPAGPACSDFAFYTFGQPVSVDRSLALQRLDYRSPDGMHRLMSRLAISRVTQPDYRYIPYKDLSEKLDRDSSGLVLTYVRSLGPDIVNDVRFSWSSSRINLTRPHPEIPVIQFLYPDNPEITFLVPSAPEAREFGMRGGQYEIVEGLTWTRGYHVITAGGGVLLRRPQYLLSYLGQGLYNFNSGNFQDFASNTQNFAAGRALYYELPLSRVEQQNGRSAPLPPAAYSQYSSNQFSGYLQDNIKLTRRLAVNLGVRYESLGAFLDETTPRGFLQLGPGNSIDQLLVKANPDLLFEKHPAHRPDRNNWAGRFGVSYSPWDRTVLRAGFGIFHDRPFDNFLLDPRNNLTTANTVLESFPAVAWNKPVDLQRSIAQVFQSGPPAFRVPLTPRISSLQQSTRTLDSRITHSDPLEMLWVDENLRTPYAQSWFASLQQRISSSFEIEVNTAGALARKLLSSDLVNRVCSLPCAPALGRLNPNLPDILYRSNAGSSNYAALGVLARYRTSKALFQASYTYGHSIDNQSDALLGDVFNLAFTNLDTVGQSQNQGIFARQFDSRADRGSSDFDIRQNLSFHSIWDLPGFRRGTWLHALTRNWTLAQIAGIRSGLPFNLFASTSGVQLPQAGGGVLAGVRRDLAAGIPVDSCAPAAACTPPQGAPPGGAQLINPAALRTPAAGQIGALGRNALVGPGFWNLDVSLAKSFGFAPLGEGGRLQVRASAFNAFNHSNLGLPNSSGFALYGPTQNQTQFPAALPVFPSPRRIQLQLKLMF